MNTTTDKANKATTEGQLAKSEERKADILAQQVEREKWMPTPTQEENDKAAMGMHVEKKPDGSPVELTPEQQAEQRRQIEAKKPSGGGYQTRDSRAAG
jgi:hypothetical protein